MPRTTKIGIAGSGFIGRGLAIALDSCDDLTLSGVYTRRDIRSISDFPHANRLTNSLDQLLEHADLVVECSGDVVHATEIVDRALKAGLPVVTMDAEFHVTTGSSFVGKGVLTEAEGDQPGSIAALAEQAVAMGLKPLVYGNRKGYYHANPPRDQMEHWAKKQGLSLDQVTAATDGTKIQIEAALVANGLGASIAQEGLLGIEADDLYTGGIALAEMARKLESPISDYVLAPKAPAGVFVACQADPRQQAALEYFKLGPGPFYVLVHNYHLCHMEIPKTIRRVLNGQGALLDNSAAPTISVAAIAKRDLKPGHKIRRGIGSFDLRGIAARICDHPDHIPIGLISDAVIERPIEAGQQLSFDDVTIPDSWALSAWRSIALSATAGSRPPQRGVSHLREEQQSMKKIRKESGNVATQVREPLVPPKGKALKRMTCRICDSPDLNEFLALGKMPLANAFLSETDLRKPEPRFELSASYCASCGLVQVCEVVDPELLFSHYTYFSSASRPMVEHFARVADDVHQTYLTDPGDLIVEIGSNDGVFLKNLVGKSRLVGVDPADNIADIAAKNGVTTVPRFFNPQTAAGVAELFGPAKVIFAANCFAHIDDLDGIMQGVVNLLDRDGVFIFENHRFADMLKTKCFDQIYHEHLCFYTLRPLEHLMGRFGMRVIDARTIPTHGESFQIHAARIDSDYEERASVAKIRAEESKLGLGDSRTYDRFAKEVEDLKTNLMRTLSDLKAQGKRIVGYGAPGKGNTLLNYCGIDKSILDYIIDTTPIKQGRFTPGTHIPILPPSKLHADKPPPEYVLLLAWNYADAILKQEKPLRDKGVKFIVPVPRLEIV